MTMELKKRAPKLDGREVWTINNGFTLNYIELSREDMLEFHRLLGEALGLNPVAVRNEKIKTALTKCITELKLIADKPVTPCDD
jgi:hypothetical protein